MELELELKFPFVQSQEELESLVKQIKYKLPENIPETFPEDFRNNFSNHTSETLKRIISGEPLKATIGFPWPGQVRRRIIDDSNFIDNDFWSEDEDPLEELQRDPGWFMRESEWDYKSSDEEKKLRMTIRWDQHQQGYVAYDVRYRGFLVVQNEKKRALPLSEIDEFQKGTRMDSIDLYMKCYGSSDSTTGATEANASAFEKGLSISLEDLDCCEWAFERRFYPINTFLWHRQTPAGKEMRRHLMSLDSNDTIEHFDELYKLVRRSCLIRLFPAAGGLEENIIIHRGKFTFHISRTLPDDWITDIVRVEVEENETKKSYDLRCWLLRSPYGIPPKFRDSFPWFLDERDLQSHVDFLVKEEEMFILEYFSGSYFPDYLGNKLSEFPKHWKDRKSKKERPNLVHQQLLKEHFGENKAFLSFRRKET